MKQSQTSKQKEQYLQNQGVLNPHPERVQDKLFLENEFFDPLDLLQVRYEMIRCHQIDKATVTETSKRFGVFLHRRTIERGLASAKKKSQT
ncbi:MAG: hypothetical protein IBX40_12570 [Methanosarcinales archaeon]|nr:hypothetical protein [Methanosarcinales archaeon]